MSFSSQRAVCYLVELAVLVLVANWIYKDANDAQAPVIQGW